MLPLLFILAETNFTSDQVATLLLAVIAALGGGGFVGKKISDARRVTVDPQPLLVQLQRDLKDEFLPRREFDNFRADTAINFTKVEAAIQRAADRIDTKHAELIETIRLAAETGTKGRVAIWDVVNEQGRKIVATETKIEIGERLERLGKELIATKPRARNGQ